MRSVRLLIAVALGLAVLPARAGLFSDEEAHARIDALRKEFDGVVQRVDQASRNQMDFANQIEALKSDIANLRGQIEVITNQIEASQKRQKDFYIDLDTRLRKLEPAVAEAKPEAPAPEAGAATPKSDGGNESGDYNAALTLLKGAKYKDALGAFQAFIKNYPSSGLQPSAHYYAASSYYQLKDYARAAELFTRLANSWPNDAKAPDALLAAGNAEIESGDNKAARKTLDALVQKYPGTNAAASAKTRLKSLKKK